MSEDFEEQAPLDDKWDDWFILADKLGENLVEITRKREQNGFRAYKMFYTWGLDVSNTAKQVSMHDIMNPERAKRGAGVFTPER